MPHATSSTRTDFPSPNFPCTSSPDSDAIALLRDDRALAAQVLPAEGTPAASDAKRIR